MAGVAAVEAVAPALQLARLVLLLLCLSVFRLGSAADPVVVRPPHGPAFRADRILVTPKPGRLASVHLLHPANRTRVLQHFAEIADLEILELPEGGDALELVARYLRSGAVESASLDHWIEPAALPNDPAVVNGTQWYLQNLGLAGGTVGADIHASAGWDTLNSASNIIVAVVDSGVRQTHEDLAANLWVNPAEIAGNGLDDDGNGWVDDVHGINAVSNNGNPEDDAGHGTHVAGIIGAVGNDALGTSGVAWRVQLMICKFLSPNGGSESSLIQCLDYARTRGAKVINCSFVAPASSISPALSNAFWSIRNAGIIVVAAAGNHGITTSLGANIDNEPEYPASFSRDNLDMDNIVVVTGTTRTDGFSGFNYGPNTVHLGAPGTDIYSTYFGSDSNYGTLSGTSMATPCVSGAIALLRARFPGMSYRQVISRLLATVDPLPSLAGRCVTGGRLNLARALGSGDFLAQPVDFDWIPTNAMTLMTLSGDGVSAAQTLPFPFRYYGEDRSHLFVGANGLLGFSAGSLNVALNTDLPNAANPNGLICPFWDDLDPSLGGTVWTGIVGAAPNRKYVVSWVNVPHAITAGGPTPFTFQAVLHESGHVTFQYLQVEIGRSTLVSGRSATIGVEDDTGLVGTRYAFNGSPVLVTNNQAVLMVPQDGRSARPGLVGSRTSLGAVFQVMLSGPPGRTVSMSASDDLVSWTPLVTNTLPASGLLLFTEPWSAPAHGRFYRGDVRP